ncbi:hypothetical protein LQ327_31945 [Actinomycetospora endophytica]|uniref:GLTT repeat-containing protein n=1 Tax=Actinomycetospora endophytica TaxID=2291215 RepID=A0ABS8PIB0_9PSEU|nr:hypothetical protein [Actinomycetospora endophytica]MCD2197993.1 hypothetical protein [Actinomycetospora endophytica]
MSTSTPAARRARAVLGGLAGSIAALAVAPGLASAATVDTPASGAAQPGAAQPGAAQPGAAQSGGRSGLGLPQLPEIPKVQALPGAGALGADPVTSVVGTALSSSALLGSDGATTPDDPTPAPTGPQYGAKPETVLGGVPVEGTLNAVTGADAIVPGSGPKDYA